MKIKILIADDNLDKQNTIKGVLETASLNVEISYAHSYNSTIKNLKSNSFDIVLLDMSMPTFDAREGATSTIKPLAGRDVLSKLKYKQSKVKVIVITQFDVFGRMTDTIELKDLELNLQENFSDNFKGCIYYDPRSSVWNEKLVKLIKGISEVE